MLYNFLNFHEIYLSDTFYKMDGVDFLFNFILLRKNIRKHFLALIYYSHFDIFINYRTLILRIYKYCNLNS